jgi:class 3 adenylate cyclase/tetratricopeptide (TPR) repeat protein
MVDLTAFSPRLLLDWDDQFPGQVHQSIAGTLVFADVSGFTALSERLARKGKVGAEEMTDVISYLFADLLGVAALRGGEMLKYGGDAMLLFFRGDEHALRASAAALEMQRRLRSIGRVNTGDGSVKLRMSVGVHSSEFDFFVVGKHHRELVVTGPATTTCAAMETAADATEIVLSPATAELVGDRYLGDAKGPGQLLRLLPRARRLAPVARDSDPNAGAFLSPLVRDHLAAGGTDSEHRVSTVAFIQMMGLDAYMRDGRTSDAARDLNATLGVIEDALEEFGVAMLGTDLVADGVKVLAVSGAPIAHEDHEERMLRAARQIVETPTPLAVRIGIQRGHAFFGAVGPLFRRTYTVMGDVVNTAARVMGRADAGEVLCLRPVLDESRSFFDASEREPFAAKGKSEPLHPWGVGANLGPKISLADDLPLVGRDAELTELLKSLETLRRDGVGGVFELVGPAGIGKTRMLAEFRASAGVPVVEAVCDPYAQGQPFFTIAPALRRVLRVESEADVARQLGDDRALLGPVMAALGLRAATEAQAPTFDQPAGVAAALESLLNRASSHVLTIDDAHHLDSASMQLLSRLARAPRCLLVLAASVQPSVPGANQVVLPPLDDHAATQLVLSSRPQGIRTDDLRKTLAAAEGNPFFLRELAGRSTDEFPDRLSTAVSASIDRLHPTDRASLRAAAAVGAIFSPETIAAVGLHPDWSALADFVAPWFDGALRFRSDIARDAAYAGLSYRDRRRIHRAIGDFLETRQDDIDRSPELARHFDAGGDHARAYRYAIASAERLEQVDAGACAEQWERAARSGAAAGVDQSEVGSAWAKAASSLIVAGDLAAAITDARRARRGGLPDAAGVARTYFVEGEAHHRRGDAHQARRAYARANRELETSGTRDATAVRLLLARAALEIDLGHFRAAAILGREARDLSVEVGDRAGRGHAADVLVVALPHCGEMEAAAEEGAVAIDVRNEVGDAYTAAAALSNLGLLETRRGSMVRAAELFERSIAKLDALNDELNGPIGRNNLGEVLITQGRPRRAAELLEVAYASFFASGHMYWPLVAANLARALARIGEPDRAVALARSAGEAMPGLGRVGQDIALVMAGRGDQVDLADVDAAGPDRVWLRLWLAAEGRAAPPADEPSIEPADAVDWDRIVLEHALRVLVAQRAGDGSEAERAEELLQELKERLGVIWVPVPGGPPPTQ